MNYSGSSPNIEKIGALKLYENSKEKGLHYTSFYGVTVTVKAMGRFESLAWYKSTLSIADRYKFISGSFGEIISFRATRNVHLNSLVEFIKIHVIINIH